MSGGEGTTSRRRPILIGAAVIATAALVGGIVLANVLGPERVDPQSVEITPQPQQVAANEPVVAAPEDADLTAVEVISDDLVSGFGGDVIDARSRVQDDSATMLEVATDDECLTEWAKANIAELAASGAYQVIDICDRPTAVLAGPAGSDSKVLVYGSLEDTAPDGMRAIIAEATSTKVAFAAVRTTDGEAQLLATAVLPD
ncbi:MULTISPECIES: hypothetical protein [unclassified Microbacterium]|uniref:hypothetical protein n=1 Tax=unclassified Microbacterium TaxID=2609290 RepID=UPI002882DD1E|nr:MULTISPECIES: hypothetical protein [unclassified Microbacterium]